MSDEQDSRPEADPSGRADAESRSRLLFLGQTYPYPPDGGVWIRSYHVLRLLARRFDVTALLFERAGGPEAGAGNDGYPPLHRYGEIESFRVPQDHSRVRFLWDHLRSVLTRRPYTAFRYASDSFRARLDELLERRDFDIVHLDSVDLHGYLPTVADLATVLVHHNVESQLLRRRAGAQESVLRRRYLEWQSERVRDAEQEWCPAVDLNVAVSEEDERRLSALAPGARTTVVPNGVDTRYFQPRDVPEEGILMVGSGTWFPNRDGARFFCEEVLPRLRRAVNGVEVRWAGRVPEEMRRDFARSYGIRMEGYVEDIRPYMARAACMLVPLRVGGGTRLKILDAWAMGKAIVSTSIGCEGLEARDGENLLIRDEPAAMADAIQQILRDEELRQRLGRAGRETVEERYAWSVVGERMNRSYRELLRPV